MTPRTMVTDDDAVKMQTAKLSSWERRLLADRDVLLGLLLEFCDEYEALERIIREKAGIPNLGVDAETVATRGRKLLEEVGRDA